MEREKQIMQAIKENKITPDIEQMMREDIRKAELKRIQQIFGKTDRT